MGVCCQKNKKGYLEIKSYFPDQYLKVLEQRYYALQPEYGLNLEKLSRLIPNIKSKHLLNRLLKYFNMKMEDQIDFNGICLLISKFLNAGQTGKQKYCFNYMTQIMIKCWIQRNLIYLFKRMIIYQIKVQEEIKILRDPNSKLGLKARLGKINDRIVKGSNKNDKVYIISSKWWDNWKQYVNMATANPGQQIDDVTQKPQQEFIEISSQLWLARPGPIDNRDIAGEYEGELKLQAKQKCDFQEVGEDAWKELLSWYGITDKRLEFKRRGKFDKDGFKIEVHPTIIQAFETDANGIVQYKNGLNLKCLKIQQCMMSEENYFRNFKLKPQMVQNICYIR